MTQLLRFGIKFKKTVNVNVEIEKRGSNEDRNTILVLKRDQQI